MKNKQRASGVTREMRSYKVAASGIELRSNADGTRTIKGIAAPFNSKSVDLGGFIEIIKPGAFKRTLKEQPDCLCLRDHMQQILLGRTTAGTLTLRETSDGLAFECKLPNNSDGDNLAVSLERGDIDTCSFGFSVVQDDWQNVDGQLIRTLIDVQLYEVSITSFAAYPASSVSLRSLPAELRGLLKRDIGDDVTDGGDASVDGLDEDVCACDCTACIAGDCECSAEPRCEMRDDDDDDDEEEDDDESVCDPNSPDYDADECEQRCARRGDSLRVRQLFALRMNN